ncbi:alpha/beta hydrolase fold domain-containing protein [Litorihabitans aurantiacus]|uniref:Esterase n=1 Tax=Litorihabitans aurantiacus TaxID=1930061 RepID=A0AA37XF86_9MICO|nr:alpha/beta hydrolase fold domain-containing protein [Litorihabitans aurantiacus]GMA31670.1 esterase [Litorihabitans aurantiacus]
MSDHPPDFHPELRRARWIPPFAVGPRGAAVMRHVPVRSQRPPAGVAVAEVAVSPHASVRLIRPAAIAAPVPVLLWIHGGGHLFGAPEQDDAVSFRLAQELGIAVAALRYRLGAVAPAPASLEDGHAALAHLAAHGEELGVDVAHLAIGGASAGGGLAAGLVQEVHDRGSAAVALQLLVYPMLDDRTVVRPERAPPHVRMWTPGSNAHGWRAYLGREPGGAAVPASWAPARREDLTGLPPAWIGTGTLDLFHDEAVDYAQRLRATGTPCDLVEVAGAFHGFDQLFPRTAVVAQFQRAQREALRAAGIVAPGR